MITYWQQIGGQMVRKDWRQLDPAFDVWVDARMVTREETERIRRDFKIDHDHLLDMQDPEEVSRIEEGDGYVLIIVRAPVNDPSAETPYFTVPIGIVIKDRAIITLCWTDGGALQDFRQNRIKGFKMSDFPAFILQILNRANSSFLKYLKEINRRSTTLQGRMRLEVENAEILQSLGLEKSLVYFTTSLKGNLLLLERIAKTRLFMLDEDDQDAIEGIRIDNKQAIEMADTYSNILFGTMDAFSHVISNNLNEVMKKLAILNLVLMVPTLITSFYGMNVGLPFDGRKYAWVLITAVCIISVYAANWILNINKRISSLSALARSKKMLAKAKK